MDRLRRVSRSISAAILALAVLLAFVPGAAQSASRIRTHVRVLAPGVTITKRVDVRKPLRTYVLTVDPSKGATFGLVLAEDRIPGLERTSSMASRGGALAAVNGDFFYETGRPLHPFALGGELVQTSRAQGPSFTVAADGSADIITPAIAITVTEVSTGGQWPIFTWNANKSFPAQLNAFTEVAGGLSNPSPNACWATMAPATEPVPTDAGMTQDFTVTVAGCAAPPDPVGEEVLLAAKPLTDDAAYLATLTAGEAVTIAWSLGRAGVTDAVGGSHLLVDGGRIVLGECTDSLCGRHPRTAAAITRDGRVLLVVVDGRQGFSRGMTLGELARFLLRIGAQEAMNLDGGGSTTLVAKGKVVNRLSDGFERGVATALIVRAPAA